MDKIFTALGLMSGTSMDGVDASIIKSDGHSKFVNVLDKYWEFDISLHKKLIDLRNEIVTTDKLIKFSNELKILERELTIFHSKIVNELTSNYSENIDLHVLVIAEIIFILNFFALCSRTGLLYVPIGCIHF